MSYHLIKMRKNRICGIRLEQDLEILFRELGVGSDPVLFDVGSNEGQTLHRFLSLWPSASIHCFEPTPELYAGLAARHPQKASIYLNQLALGDCEGQSVLRMASNSQTNSLLTSKDQGGGSLLGKPR